MGLSTLPPDGLSSHFAWLVCKTNRQSLLGIMGKIDWLQLVSKW